MSRARKSRSKRPNPNQVSIAKKIYMFTFCLLGIGGFVLLSIELNPKPPFPSECNLEDKATRSYVMVSTNSEQMFQSSKDVISKASGGGSSAVVVDILQPNGEVEILFSGTPKKRELDEIGSKLAIRSTELQPKVELLTGLNRLTDIVSASRNKAVINATIVADVGSDELTLTNIKTAAKKLQGEYCLHINVKGVDSKNRLKVATALSSLKSVQIDNPVKYSIS
jgi:hypothetical protein